LANDDDLNAWLAAMPGKAHFIFETDRKALYRAPELYAGYDPADPGSWTRAFDSRVNAWFLDGRNPRQLDTAGMLAARLHDTTIGQALTAFPDPDTWIVGFMGGHDAHRDDPAFRQIALAARALRKKGFTIVSGGGPGLMEAANFGAFMAPYSDNQFDAALAALMTQPDTSKPDLWVGTAASVRATLLGRWDAAERQESYNIGIPTWLYGYEPPNLFATHIAKYFFNSVREDGLITIANGGIVFGPGAAGTVQEIFQDANLNYYGTHGQTPAPMVLLGVDFWNPTESNDTDCSRLDPMRKPAFALLKVLAGQSSIQPPGAISRALLLTDSTEEAVAFIGDKGAKIPKASSPKEARLKRFRGRALALR
jgi:predicted Rossmann-fold nucleotide-binding protein